MNRRLLLLPLLLLPALAILGYLMTRSEEQTLGCGTNDLECLGEVLATREDLSAFLADLELAATANPSSALELCGSYGYQGVTARYRSFEDVTTALTREHPCTPQIIAGLTNVWSAYAPTTEQIDDLAGRCGSLPELAGLSCADGVGLAAYVNLELTAALDRCLTFEGVLTQRCLSRILSSTGSSAADQEEATSRVVEICTTWDRPEGAESCAAASVSVFFPPVLGTFPPGETPDQEALSAIDKALGLCRSLGDFAERCERAGVEFFALTGRLGAQGSATRETICAPFSADARSRCLVAEVTARGPTSEWG